ncbi:MAG: flagellar filament capping protein FliD [Peptococcaceae bacterium]
MSIRIGGLASGIDTDQIISDLMKAQRTKVDKLKQDKIIVEWRQEIYNALNKDLANFILDTKKEFGLTSTSSSGSLLNKSVSSLEWVKKAASSDTGIADIISTRADAVTGSYSVSVSQIAKNFSAASQGDLGNLDTLKEQFGLNDTDVIKFTIESKDGVSQTFEYSGDDLNNKTILDMANDINSYRDSDGNDLGVKAVYDTSINRLFFQTTETGEANGFTITQEAEATVEFFTGTNDKLQLNLTSGAVNQGQDAILSFNGADNIRMASNQCTINNINLDLKAEGDFTVTVSTDVDAVYEKISAFVEKYNEIVSKLNDTLNEKRYRDYTPLTEEQKESMSEKEIELWEEKAKSGLIKGDGVLQSTYHSMRSGMYDNVAGVSGAFDQLTQIGISTQNYFSGSKGGQLEIDETNLKKAIQEDVDGVLELLFKEPGAGLDVADDKLSNNEIQQKRSESGLIRRLYDNITVGMKEIINKAGTGDNPELYRNVNSSILIDFVTEHGSISMLDKSISDYEDRIDDMNDYLTTVENRYWQQFTAMEKAIQDMNSQSTWLTQMFSSGQ